MFFLSSSLSFSRNSLRFRSSSSFFSCAEIRAFIFASLLASLFWFFMCSTGFLFAFGVFKTAFFCGFVEIFVLGFVVVMVFLELLLCKLVEI